MRRFLLALPIIAGLPSMMIEVPAASLALNGVSLNRLAANKLAANRLAANRLAANRLAANRLAANGLDPNALDQGFGPETPLVAVTSITLSDGTIIALAD